MLFACIFVPDFPAAAIVRAEPELRGAAVAVLEGTPPMLTVVSANEHARHAGVELGMTKLQAEAHLAALATAKPQKFSVVRRRSIVQETAARAALGDCARGISPRVEEPENTPATVLLDISGLERLFGTPKSIAVELARRAAELGLEANVAVCTNLDAAICAARGFLGVTVIDDTAATRLAPLGLHVLIESAGIEAPVANELLDTFERWGVRTCRAFAALPEVAVAERLGPQGVHLQKLARGEGTRTLAPTEPPSEFEEAIDLEYPIEDLESLAFVLNRLIEQLCTRLQARALSTNELQLRMQLDHSQNDTCLSHSPDHPITQSPGSSSAHPPEYIRAIRLPVPMLDAKIFLRLWQLELRSNPFGAPVEKIWLRAEPVEPRFTQGGLFLPTAPEPERLEVTLARIAGVVRTRNSNGHDELRVGTAEVLDTYAPDAFHMKRFAASSVEKKSTSQTVNTASTSQTIIRRFRPPTAISVEVCDGRPTIIRQAPGPFQPESKIAWCAGPWQNSGEWWKNAWSREEWDVAIIGQHGDMFCRMYRDAISNAWFLEGTYD